MIEKIVLDYLNGALTVPVYMEKPAKAPEEYVLLEKTGSSGEDYIYTAVIVVQSHAASMYAAAVLNEQVKKAMEKMEELDAVSSVDLNSDYNFTDTRSKKYRYQAVYEVTY